MHVQGQVEAALADTEAGSSAQIAALLAVQQRLEQRLREQGAFRLDVRPSYLLRRWSFPFVETQLSSIGHSKPSRQEI